MQPYQLLYEDKFFSKYLRNGLVVDSCVLFDFLKFNYLGQKENYTFSEDEKELFFQLERFLSIGSTKYITPHILAEVSNLINKKTSNIEEFSKMIDILKEKIEEYEEIHFNKSEILSEASVNEFGITDIGIKILSKKDEKMILTRDDPFCNHCKYTEKLPTIHTNDLKSLFLTLKMFRD